MGRCPDPCPGMGDFLTTIADFRGWGVRGLGGVPRRVRDGAGVTLGSQKRWIFGPELAPTGPLNDSNDLDLPPQRLQRSRLCKKMNLGVGATEAQLGLAFEFESGNGLDCVRK